ncbi:MAG: hypothetical protein UU93_C0001G0057 [Candidatus Amesbacteria bacterium GW2011_GWA2_42_12]|uniref:Uncharacterized protein n=1 Tax=Candidatus Amesbacteria bacterium GW2011_GWA2_42_12 TaxID=1618356 RepID=A0A0G1AGJ9_9BACT|nr:MAG: hypothetical protein UU93_C0001G0057 [Candidatus Amesbacteria bacterium GW2011_GWA2_42_12]
MIAEILNYLRERNDYLIKNGRLSNSLNATAAGFVLGYAGGSEIFGSQVLGIMFLFLAVIPFTLSVATEKDLER